MQEKVGSRHGDVSDSVPAVGRDLAALLNIILLFGRLPFAFPLRRLVGYQDAADQQD